MIPRNAVFPASVHQDCRAHDIRFQKDARIFNRPVYMGLSGKIDNYIRTLFLKQLIHCRSVANIGLDEAEIRIRHNRLQCRQIPCIGQLIQAYNTVFRMRLKHMKHKITANKSGTAGNDYVHNSIMYLNVSIFVHHREYQKISKKADFTYLWKSAFISLFSYNMPQVLSKFIFKIISPQGIFHHSL